MSAKESNKQGKVANEASSNKPATDDGAANATAGAEDRKVPFAESDYHATKMAYDHGRLPFYVAGVWLLTLAGLITYFISYAIPDLQRWGAP